MTNLAGAGHHLVKGGLDLILNRVRNHRDRQGIMRLRPHRVTVAQRVIRRDLPEHERILHQHGFIFNYY